MSHPLKSITNANELADPIQLRNRDECTYNDLDLSALVGEVDGDLVKLFGAGFFDHCVIRENLRA
jgi:hypothetical protein